jgi:hypothetical protein
MSGVDEHKTWLRDTTRRFLQHIARWRRRLKLWLTIGGALIAGTAGAAANFLDQKWRWPLYVVQIFGLLMVAAGAALVEYLDENTAEAISRAGDLAETVEQRDAELASLEEDYSFSVRLQAVAVALRGIVDEVAAYGPGSEDTQRARFGSMLDFIVAERVILFEMDTDRFNFAIYIYDDADQALHCAACRRPIRAEELADHRIWDPGEGHVGMAFQGKREYIAGDTARPDARQIFEAPEPKRRSDDPERYKSIASIPIRLGKGDPVGVLVATSDVASRFYLPSERGDPARDPVEPLRVLAREVALIIELTDLYRRVGVDES